MKGKQPAKAVALSTALLKRTGPPPALPLRPGGESGGVGVGSLGLGPTSISGGFGSNGSSGTGGFGSNGGGPVPKSPMFRNGGSGWAGASVGGATGVSTNKKGKDKAAADLAHCFELHSGKLLGDKKNREGRLYFKVCWREIVGCPCVFLLTSLSPIYVDRVGLISRRHTDINVV